MTKAELESKHLAELHALAAEADVPRYRMLRREELIERLSGGDGGSRRERQSREGERPPRRRRESGGRDRRPREREPRPAAARAEEAPEPAAPKPAPAARAEAPAARAEAPAARAEAPAPKRKRRRRRFGRRGKGLRALDLLTPPPGRQALVYGESRAACTALLREIAAEVAEGSIALLVDPSPEELADWKREAPRAELVVAAQARHASDALAQAARRAESGEDVTLLVDSLTRLEDADAAKEIFDGGLNLKANGSLTVVAALERPS
jgi:hypothetical protein